MPRTAILLLPPVANLVGHSLSIRAVCQRTVDVPLSRAMARSPRNISVGSIAIALSRAGAKDCDGHAEFVHSTTQALLCSASVFIPSTGDPRTSLLLARL